MKKTLTNNTKKMIRIGLTEDEETMLISYSKGIKQSLSAAGRNLILTGFDNINTAENLKDDLKFLVSKLERKNEELQNIIKENEKKTMKMMMNILKYGAKNNSLIKTFEAPKSKMEREEFVNFADKVEANSIKIMFSKIKKDGENEDELV